MGGMMMPPISVTATMLRRCARLSGVSRGTSTRRRRSLSTTSAARETRSSACACATAASVFIEQGAITMPSVMNEALEVLALHLVLVPEVEHAGVGEHQMALPAGDFLQRAQERNAVDRAGRAG